MPLRRWINRKWLPVITVGFILATSLLKLWLDLAVRIKAESWQSFDDALYVNQAFSLLASQWLGDYNNLTLAKGPMYPIWLALNNLIGWPLLFSQSLLYLIAGLVLLVQLRKLFEPGVKTHLVLITFFLLYIFNPFIEVRLMREGIYSSLTVLVIAGWISLYNHLNNSKKGLFARSLLSGLALSAFWLTREEGLWILPTLILLTAYILYRLYSNFYFSSEFFKRAGICLLPIATLLASLHLVSSTNERHYGVYTVVEQKSLPFTSAYGALLRVKHPNWVRYLHVPKEVRLMIYEASPAFKELKPYIDGNLGKVWQRRSWVSDTCNFYPMTCPDYGGTWFMWVFREAVADAGYYSSAITAETYFHRLAQEVNAACNSQQLNCQPLSMTTIPPYRSEYTPLMVSTFFTGLQHILSLPVRDYVFGFYGKSRGDKAGVWRFSELTNNRALPSVTGGEPPYKQLTTTDRFKLSVLQAITTIYQAFLPMMSWLILPALLLSMLLALRHNRVTFLLVLNIGILSALVGRLLILSYIDISMFPAFNLWPSYIGVFFPLLFILLVMSIFDAVSQINTWFTNAATSYKVPPN